MQRPLERKISERHIANSDKHLRLKIVWTVVVGIVNTRKILKFNRTCQHYALKISSEFESAQFKNVTVGLMAFRRFLKAMFQDVRWLSQLQRKKSFAKVEISEICSLRTNPPHFFRDIAFQYPLIHYDFLCISLLKTMKTYWIMITTIMHCASCDNLRYLHLSNEDRSVKNFPCEWLD